MADRVQDTPNREFVTTLRTNVEEYLRTVDEWEAVYRKFYRLNGTGDAVSQDMEEPHRKYLDARKRLEVLIPRARRLSYRYGVRDVWPSFMRTKLGARGPQSRTTSAISRSERAAVTESLARLAAASEEEVRAAEWGQEPQPGWLRRVLQYFLE